MTKETAPDGASAEFDQVAAEYDAALSQGIGVSGEDKEYFADGRVRWMRDCLDRLGLTARSVMDYGCGTGTATPFLIETLGCDRVVGVDVSDKSLEIARHQFGTDTTTFFLVDDYKPEASIDAAYCNGTFHHIEPEIRPAALKFVYDSLRPGGVFALWENNPWNVGTQYVMWRCPFDVHAIKVSAPGARRLLKAAGFEILGTDFYFIFPNFLRALRGLEAPLAPLPLGAQYQVLCRKPER